MTRIACPGCGRMKPVFAIVNGKCDEDRREEDQAAAQPPALSWNDIRAQRNIRLQVCDWTQVPDADLTTEEVSAWKTYRQALRDIPETYPSPAAVIWPTPPQ